MMISWVEILESVKENRLFTYNDPEEIPTGLGNFVEESM